MVIRVERSPLCHFSELLGVKRQNVCPESLIFML